ncbi:hypothetical protein HQ403_01930 [Candidatus Kaiserbacteria bacterium]|nr:hypothetical protein [Candidatus Kaiserbacteria bacterium]
MSDIGLINFISTVKKDPLFAAEGLDLDNARKALLGLGNSVDELEEAWGGIISKLFFIKHPPRESLHPIEFLENFIESEYARRVFLKSGSKEDADALLNQWRETQKSYTKNLFSYKKALLEILKIEEIDPNAKIDYFSLVGSIGELLSWVDRLLENAEELDSEIKKLGGILKGEEQIFRKSNDNRDKLIIEKADLPKLPQIDSNLEELVRVATIYTEKKKAFGPIVYWLGHFNEGKITPHRFLVYIGTSKHTNCKMVTILLADDMYFLNLKRDHFMDLSIYEPVMKKGLNYWYQPAAAIYNTLDASYWADIVTIADIKDRKFINEEQVLQQRSSLLDLLIGAGVSAGVTFTKLIKIVSHHKESAKLSYLYAARAYPTLYFLSFNQSVWRIEESPYLFGTRFAKESHYESYTDLKDKVPFDVLRDIVETSVMRTEYFKKKLGV